MITAIMIAVVVLLTGIIFGLAWVAYKFCLKAYKSEVVLGKHDIEIYSAYSITKSKKILKVVESIILYIIIVILAILFTIGLVAKTKDNGFIIGNKTVMVIASGSMANFYNEEIAKEYNYDNSLQFDIGDICIFETNFDLVEGEVYGYKYKDYIITHRLVSQTETSCRFRGDANASYDARVNKDCVIYHYTGKKIPKIGLFILYAKSYFGIWSLIGIICIMVFSEIAEYKVNKIDKERYNILNNIKEGAANEN